MASYKSFVAPTSTMSHPQPEGAFQQNSLPLPDLPASSTYRPSEAANDRQTINADWIENPGKWPLKIESSIKKLMIQHGLTTYSEACPNNEERISRLFDAFYTSGVIDMRGWRPAVHDNRLWRVFEAKAGRLQAEMLRDGEVRQIADRYKLTTPPSELQASPLSPPAVREQRPAPLLAASLRTAGYREAMEIWNSMNAETQLKLFREQVSTAKSALFFNYNWDLLLAETRQKDVEHLKTYVPTGTTKPLDVSKGTVKPLEMQKGIAEPADGSKGAVKLVDVSNFSQKTTLPGAPILPNPNFPLDDNEQAIQWLQSKANRDFSAFQMLTAKVAHLWEGLEQLMSNVTGIPAKGLRETTIQSMIDIYGEDLKKDSKRVVTAEEHMIVAKDAIPKIMISVADTCEWKEDIEDWLLPALATMCKRYTSSLKKRWRDQKTRGRTSNTIDIRDSSGRVVQPLPFAIMSTSTKSQQTAEDSAEVPEIPNTESQAIASIEPGDLKAIIDNRIREVNMKRELEKRKASDQNEENSGQKRIKS